MKEVKAQLRHLRMSPKKVQLVADLVRGMHVNDAQLQLQACVKAAKRPVLKLLNSAIANAQHNDNLKPETLRIKEIYVNQGPTLKRWQPRAFGRAGMIRKRTSHVTIIVTGEAAAEQGGVKVDDKAAKKGVLKVSDDAKKETKKTAAKKKTSDKESAKKATK